MLDEGLFGRCGVLGRNGEGVRVGLRGWIWGMGLGNSRRCGSVHRFCMWCRRGGFCWLKLRRVFVVWRVVFIIREACCGSVGLGVVGVGVVGCGWDI